MRSKSIALAACLLLALEALHSPAVGMPKLSQGTRADGVIAYQDATDKTQFWYWPASIPMVLGLTLTDPTVKYWGIGRKFLQKEPDLGTWVWTMGGTISGTATIDITPHQEASIRAAIQRDFNPSTIKLLPLDAEPSNVAPMFAENTIGGPGGDSKFGDGHSFKIGGKYPFVVGSPNNHTFAEYIATENSNGASPLTDSSFGVYLVGSAQFQGDPWEFDCKANLGQVWSKVRQRYGLGVGYSWLSINADYASIEQDLLRTKVIDCNFTSGQLDFEKYGTQLFDLSKQVLTSLNDPDNEYFRFAPNPEPEDIAQKDFKSTAGWNISINAAYSAAHATNNIKFEEHVSYTGTVRRDIPSTLTLAIQCNQSTEQYFQESGVSERCVTRKKAKQFDQWAADEKKCKNDRIKELYKQYAKDHDGVVYAEGIRLNKIMDCSNSILLLAPESVSFNVRTGLSKDSVVAVSVTDEMIDNILANVAKGKKLKEAIYSLSEVKAAIK